LQYALSRTSNGGTISVLTSGNFGAVIIDKSVTIEAAGVVARSDGVVINAPTNRAVTLRGLIFDRNGDTSHDVVRFLQGRSLLVEKCVVRRGRYGVRF
jgi:hypothetical protein